MKIPAPFYMLVLQVFLLFQYNKRSPLRAYPYHSSLKKGCPHDALPRLLDFLKKPA